MTLLRFRALDKQNNPNTGTPSSYVEVTYRDEDTNLISELTFSQVDNIFKVPVQEALPDVSPPDRIFPSIGEVHEILDTQPSGNRHMVELLDLLSNVGIDLKSDEAISKITKLEVEARGTEFIYDLPWESIFKDRDSSIPVVRRKYGAGSFARELKNENYVFLISQGFDESGHPSYPRIIDDLQQEALTAYKNIFEDITGSTKPQLLTVLRYLSRDSLKSIDLKSYSIIHLMLHGREDGYLGFEDASDHRKIEWIPPEAFVELLKPHRYELVFLSCCYSGYGDRDRQSLAQMLINEGVAKTVVAFNGSMGSNVTLPGFVEKFYGRYSFAKDPEDAFIGAVDFLHRGKNRYRDKPVLFTGGAL